MSDEATIFIMGIMIGMTIGICIGLFAANNYESPMEFCEKKAMIHGESGSTDYCIDSNNHFHKIIRSNNRFIMQEVRT